MWAQFTSSMEGTVMDPSGARIPGAAVAVVNTATNIKTAAETNSVGFFLFPSLAPGNYNLTVVASGFKTAEVADLRLEVDQRRTANVALEVGAQATTVSVEASAVSVDLSEVRLQGRVENRQILELPISGQNFLALASLTAGITGNGGSQDVFQGQAGVSISANGMRGEQNGFSVDAATVTSMVRHGQNNLTPNAESIDEVQVSVNNFSAEAGQDAGANINVLTKSGTNAYHGSAGWYHTDNLLNSRTFFQNVPNPVTGRILPVTRRNEWVGSFGGPIRKNRTFAFFSMDILRQTTASNSLTTVETPEFANYVTTNFANNKSGYLMKRFPTAVVPVTLFRTVGNNVSPAIDCSKLSSPSTLISTPIGNMPCNMNMTGQGITPVTSFRNGKQWNVRVDHMLATNDRLYVNMYRNGELSTAGSTIRPGFLMDLPVLNWYGNINETHTFSSTVINELRATVVRIHGEIKCAVCSIPSTSVSGATSFNGFGTGGPTPYMQNNYEYKDNVSIIHGGHSIKGGIVFSFLQSNWKPTAGYTRPSFSFNNIFDFINDNVYSEGNIGFNPVSGTVYTPDVAERQHTQGWFLQDTWKIRPNLTMTYGVRWEYYGMVNQATEGNNVQWRGGSTFIQKMALGANVTKYHILDHGDKNNYAPRFSMAWDPTNKGKTSIRTGVGIFYDFLPSQLYGGAHFTPPIFMLVTASPVNPPLTPNYAFGASDSQPYNFPRPLGLEKAIGLDSRNGSSIAKSGITWIDPNLKSSYTTSWFFGIQQALTNTMTVDFNYVGNVGRKLYSKFNVNRWAGDFIANGGTLARINPSFGSISWGSANTDSAYNGLNVTVRKRFSHGLMFNSALTVGHAISMSDSFDFSPSDAWNTKLDRAATGVPRKLAVSAIYEIPTPTSSYSWLNGAIKGWQLSGIVTMTAGGYFSVTCGSATPGVVKDPSGKVIGLTGCDYNGDGQNGDRPNAPSFGSHLDLSRDNLLKNGVFKVADFPTPAFGQLGNLGRNTFRGLWGNNTDLAMSKNFGVPWFVKDQQARLQFRAEAFNAFNRTNLGNPNNTLTGSNFGIVTGASGARRFQFSLLLRF